MKTITMNRMALLCTGALLAVSGEGWSQQAAAGWLKVLGNASEEMKTLDGQVFRAGHFIGTSIVPAKDTNFLVGGYLRAYPAHPVELGLLKADPSGQVLWFREYASERIRKWTTETRVGNFFAWAEIATVHDGGAVVVFGSVLLRVDERGTPLWARRYLHRRQDQQGKELADPMLKSVIALENGDFVICGVLPGTIQGRGGVGDIMVARLDSAGTVRWAREYPELHGCEHPILHALSDGQFIVGSEPAAIIKLGEGGGVVWAKTLFSEPFTRGSKSRPDRGSLLRYQTLGLTTEGGMIFSGIYDLSSGTYRAPGALLCRVTGDGSKILWSERIHSPMHGGETAVRAIRPAGDDLYCVGVSTEFGATEAHINNNALVLHISGSGNLNWLRSIGKKKTSVAQSEYRNDLANALVTAPDGGVILAGATNSFAHPDPNFNTVINWQKEHYDLLLARLNPSGGIQDLPIGKYPKLMSMPDDCDTRKLEVLPVPIGIKTLDVTPKDLSLTGEPCEYSSSAGDSADQFSTTNSETIRRGLAADFKLLPPLHEGDTDVRFDGSVSLAPKETSIVRYHWTFGNKTTGTGAQVSKRYDTAGTTQEVTLIVEDRNGIESAPVTKKVVVGSIVRGQGIPAAIASGKAASYKISILTGDCQDAGTGAVVFLNLYGPEDKDGQRQASGDAFLPEGPAAAVFERGQLSSFELSKGSEMKWELDLVDHMILRHNNRNAKDGWYVQGVKVENLITKKEWLFAPDQWLADDEPPDRRTWGKFTPVEPYGCGIVFQGDSHSVGMTEASDNIFILPEDVTEFRFTMLDKGSGLTVKSAADVVIGTVAPAGSGKIVLPFIAKENWGVTCKVSDLKVPTRFKIETTSGDKARTTEVWVFPSNWAGYEREARRIAILYHFDGRTSVLSCGEKYRDFLIARAAEAKSHLLPNMSPITDYGLASFGLFGDIPDERLKWYMESNTETYTKFKVVKILSKGTNDKAFQRVVGQYFDMLNLLVKARNWAQMLPKVITLTTNQVYSPDLVDELGSNDANLKQAAAIMSVLETKVENLLARVRGDSAKKISGNDPAECRKILQDIRMLCVGPNPCGDKDSDHHIKQSDYVSTADGYLPLGLIFPQALKNIADWRAGQHPFYSNTKLLYYGRDDFDPHGATGLAMDVYEPVIRTMIQVAAPLIDASLTVDDKDSQWLK